MNMKKAPNTNKLKYVGAALLEGESVTLIQAARLVLEIKEALGDEICTITRCREVVSLGLNAIKNKHQTVSFGTAAVECLRSKSHRRPRTLTDIRSIIHKLKKSNPELEHTSLRNLSVEECQNILMNTFTTSRQRHKARLILSGIFSFSVKRGWCDENPILRVDTPFLQEQEIPALTLKEITQLLKAAMEEFDGADDLCRNPPAGSGTPALGKHRSPRRLYHSELQAYQNRRRQARHHPARARQMAQILP